MLITLSFKAQALDNTSPDTLVDRGRVLGPKETVARQEFVYRLSQASLAGTTLCDSGGVCVTRYHFNDRGFAPSRQAGRHQGVLLRVETEQRDSLGRGGPVLAWIETAAESDPQNTPFKTEDVVHEITKFIQSIDRSLSADVQRQLENAVSIARSGHATFTWSSLTPLAVGAILVLTAVLAGIGIWNRKN